MGIVIDIVGSRDHRQSHEINSGQGVAKQAKIEAIRRQNKRTAAKGACATSTLRFG